MDITELLNSALGKQMINGIGSQTGASEKEAASVVSAAAPVLLGMLHKNATSGDGASSLMNALNDHDGSVLNNLSGFFQQGGNTDDGDGILKHVLGDKRSTVENAISQQTGVGLSKVTSMLSMLAPLIMGYLGRQTRNSGSLGDNSGLGNILGGLLGNTANSSAGGDILGSLLGNALGGGQKSGGLGGLLGSLGGLFGKK